MSISKVCSALMCGALFVGAAGTAVIAGQPTTKPAAKPTTHPTTRPSAASATRPATPRDWVAFESKEHGLRFRVPKNWQRLELTSSVDTTDFLFYFDAAPPKSPGEIDRQFQVAIGQPCHGDATLEATTESARATVRQQNPKVEFIVDSEIDFAGHKAWQLEWRGTASFTRTTRTNNGPPVSKTIEVKTHDRQLIWVENQRLYSFTFHADEPGYPAMAKLVEKVMDSIERTK